jgi:hypothetical protein
MKVFLVSLVLVSALAACSDGEGSPPQKFVATYEVQAGCSTGVRTVSAASFSHLEYSLCEELIDQVSNSSCGLIQREQIFNQLNCASRWPYNTSNSGFGTSTRSYSYEVNGCRTGSHFFATNAEFSTMRLYCKALSDELRNNSCAYNQRRAAYLEVDCDSYL